MQDEIQKRKFVSLVIIRIEIDDLGKHHLEDVGTINTSNSNFKTSFQYKSPACLAKKELKQLTEEFDRESVEQFIGKRQTQLIQIETYHFRSSFMQKNSNNSNKHFESKSFNWNWIT